MPRSTDLCAFIVQRGRYNYSTERAARRERTLDEKRVSGVGAAAPASAVAAAAVGGGAVGDACGGAAAGAACRAGGAGGAAGAVGPAGADLSGGVSFSHRRRRRLDVARVYRDHLPAAPAAGPPLGVLLPHPAVPLVHLLLRAGFATVSTENRLRIGEKEVSRAGRDAANRGRTTSRKRIVDVCSSVHRRR